ncbi:MAG: histidine phosphatase family protein [Acidimicrobiia bacterium]|nr:histidine phosphatase family protein [Acidimicrobiia bacterium]
MSRHTTLTLVRHGESEVTVRQVFGGATACTGLSPLGVRQAEALRGRLHRTIDLAIDELWASTLPRAIETAEVVAPSIGGLRVRTDPDLEELRPGPEADGTPFAEYEQRFGSFDQWAQPHRPIAPGGETLASFHHRVGRALFALTDRAPGRSIMVVCHGGVIDAAFRSLVGYSQQSEWLWSLNTSITEFRRLLDDDGAPTGQWMLMRFNDAAHLEGLPRHTERD